MLSTDAQPLTRKDALALAVAGRLGRFLRRWGVDPAQYQWLLLTSLKLDFRSENLMPGREGLGSTTSALTMTVVMYLLFSSLMSAMLAFSGAGTLLFSGILLGYAMLMLAMSILIEFGSTVINPDDFHILGPRPVSSGTYFAVKFSNLAFYILIFGSALNLIPAFVGLACPGARFYFPLVYFLVALLASLFVAGAIIALYGWLLRLVHYEKFKDIITYCQIVFSFLFFFGYQLIPRYVENGLKGSAVSGGWTFAIPSFWFAGLVEVLLGRVDVSTAMLAAMGLLGFAGFFTVLLRSVSLDYAEHLSHIVSMSGEKATASADQPSSGRPARWFQQLLLPTGEERAFFYFILTMIRRNRQLKLQLYPNLGIIIALVVLAIVQEENIADPFVQMPRSFAAFAPVLAFLFAAVGLYSVLPYSDEYRGHWIFQLAPLGKRERVLKAVKKAIVSVVFAPLLALNVIIFSFFWPVSHAFWHSLYGVLVGYLFLQVLLFKFSDVPFSRKLEKGTQTERVVIGLMFLPIIGGVVFLLRWVAGNWTAYLLTLGILAGVSLILSWLNNLWYARRGRTVEGAVE
jgi:hypothetical protein